MSLQYGLYLPQRFVHELAGMKNPVEAYETLIRLAQTTDQSGYDTIPDLFAMRRFAPCFLSMFLSMEVLSNVDQLLRLLGDPYGNRAATTKRSHVHPHATGPKKPAAAGCRTRPHTIIK